MIHPRTNDPAALFDNCLYCGGMYYSSVTWRAALRWLSIIGVCGCRQWRGYSAAYLNAMSRQRQAWLVAANGVSGGGGSSHLSGWQPNTVNGVVSGVASNVAAHLILGVLPGLISWRIVI